MPRGIAFVRYNLSSQAQAAIDALNQKVPEGSDLKLNVKLADKYYTMKQEARKRQFPGAEYSGMEYPGMEYPGAGAGAGAGRGGIRPLLGGECEPVSLREQAEKVGNRCLPNIRREFLVHLFYNCF